MTTLEAGIIFNCTESQFPRAKPGLSLYLLLLHVSASLSALLLIGARGAALDLLTHSHTHTHTYVIGIDHWV